MALAKSVWKLISLTLRGSTSLTAGSMEKSAAERRRRSGRLWMSPGMGAGSLGVARLTFLLCLAKRKKSRKQSAT